MNILKMLKSFVFAFQGIKTLIKSENNARFHFLATLLVFGAGIYLQLSSTEWAIIITQIGLVWSAEAFNTAIEKICNFISPERREIIGEIKDLAAAGVVVVSIIAAVVGIIIFGTKILTL